MVKTIKQKVALAMTPHEAYEMLMDSKKHSKFTGGKAIISQKVGGEFSAYNGYSEGTNLKLIPDKKIVQKWRANDWPEGMYSTATFTFAKTKTGTTLTFVQTDVPPSRYEEVRDGWTEFYWERMK